MKELGTYQQRVPGVAIYWTRTPSAVSAKRPVKNKDGNTMQVLSNEAMDLIGTMLISLGAEHGDDTALAKWDVELSEALKSQDEGKLRDLLATAEAVLDTAKGVV